MSSEKHGKLRICIGCMLNSFAPLLLCKNYTESHNLTAVFTYTLKICSKHEIGNAAYIANRKKL